MEVHGEISVEFHGMINNSQNFIIRDQHQISIQLLQGAK